MSKADLNTIKIAGKVINFQDLENALKNKNNKENSIFGVLDAFDGKDGEIQQKTIDTFIDLIKQYGQKHNKKNLGNREYKKLEKALAENGITLDEHTKGKKNLGNILYNLINNNKATEEQPESVQTPAATEQQQPTVSVPQAEEIVEKSGDETPQGPKAEVSEGSKDKAKTSREETSFDESGDVMTTKSYDANNRLVRERTETYADGSLTPKTEVTEYDENGNVKSKTTNDNNTYTEEIYENGQLKTRYTKRTNENGEVEETQANYENGRKVSESSARTVQNADGSSDRFIVDEKGDNTNANGTKQTYRQKTVTRQTHRQVTVPNGTPEVQAAPPRRELDAQEKYAVSFAEKLSGKKNLDLQSRNFGTKTGKGKLTYTGIAKSVLKDLGVTNPTTQQVMDMAKQIFLINVPASKRNGVSQYFKEHPKELTSQLMNDELAPKAYKVPVTAQSLKQYKAKLEANQGNWTSEAPEITRGRVGMSLEKELSAEKQDPNVLMNNLFTVFGGKEYSPKTRQNLINGIKDAKDYAKMNDSCQKYHNCDIITLIGEHTDEFGGKQASSELIVNLFDRISKQNDNYDDVTKYNINKLKQDLYAILNDKPFSAENIAKMNHIFSMLTASVLSAANEADMDFVDAAGRSVAGSMINVKGNLMDGAKELAQQFYDIIDDKHGNAGMNALSEFLNNNISTEIAIDFVVAYNEAGGRQQDHNIFDSVFEEIGASKKQQQQVCDQIINLLKQSAIHYGAQLEDVNAVINKLSKTSKKADDYQACAQALIALSGKDVRVGVQGEFDSARGEDDWVTAITDFASSIVGSRTRSQMGARITEAEKELQELSRIADMIKIAAPENKEQLINEFNVKYEKIFGVKFNPKVLAERDAVELQLIKMEVAMNNTSIIDNALKQSSVNGIVNALKPLGDTSLIEMLQDIDDINTIKYMLNSEREFYVNQSLPPKGESRSSLEAKLNSLNKASFGTSSIGDEVASFNKNTKSEQMYGEMGVDILATLAIEACTAGFGTEAAAAMWSARFAKFARAARLAGKAEQAKKFETAINILKSARPALGVFDSSLKAGIAVTTTHLTYGNTVEDAVSAGENMAIFAAVAGTANRVIIEKFASKLMAKGMSKEEAIECLTKTFKKPAVQAFITEQAVILGYANIQTFIEAGGDINALLSQENAMNIIIMEALAIGGRIRAARAKTKTPATEAQQQSSEGKERGVLPTATSVEESGQAPKAAGGKLNQEKMNKALTEAREAGAGTVQETTEAYRQARMLQGNQADAAQRAVLDGAGIYESSNFPKFEIAKETDLAKLQAVEKELNSRIQNSTNPENTARLNENLRKINERIQELKDHPELQGQPVRSEKVEAIQKVEERRADAVLKGIKKSGRMGGVDYTDLKRHLNNLNSAEEIEAFIKDLTESTHTNGRQTVASIETGTDYLAKIMSEAEAKLKKLKVAQTRYNDATSVLESRKGQGLSGEDYQKVKQFVENCDSPQELARIEELLKDVKKSQSKRNLSKAVEERKAHLEAEAQRAADAAQAGHENATPAEVKPTSDPKNTQTQAPNAEPTPPTSEPKPAPVNSQSTQAASPKTRSQTQWEAFKAELDKPAGEIDLTKVENYIKNCSSEFQFNKIIERLEELKKTAGERAGDFDNSIDMARRNMETLKANADAARQAYNEKKGAAAEEAMNPDEKVTPEPAADEPAETPVVDSPKSDAEIKKSLSRSLAQSFDTMVNKIANLKVVSGAKQLYNQIVKFFKNSPEAMNRLIKYLQDKVKSLRTTGTKSATPKSAFETETGMKPIGNRTLKDVMPELIKLADRKNAVLKTNKNFDGNFVIDINDMHFEFDANGKFLKSTRIRINDYNLPDIVTFDENGNLSEFWTSVEISGDIENGTRKILDIEVSDNSTLIGISEHEPNTIIVNGPTEYVTPEEFKARYGVDAPHQEIMPVSGATIAAGGGEIPAGGAIVTSGGAPNASAIIGNGTVIPDTGSEPIIPQQGGVKPSHSAVHTPTPTQAAQNPNGYTTRINDSQINFAVTNQGFQSCPNNAKYLDFNKYDYRNMLDGEHYGELKDFHMSYSQRNNTSVIVINLQRYKAFGITFEGGTPLMRGGDNVTIVIDGPLTQQKANNFLNALKGHITIGPDKSILNKTEIVEIFNNCQDV